MIIKTEKKKKSSLQPWWQLWISTRERTDVGVDEAEAGVTIPEAEEV